MANQILPEASKLAAGWQFYWPVMDVLIGGKSAIDLPYLTMSSPSEADEFLRSYGYNMASQEDRRRAHALIIEAWSFIESTLMPVEWKKGVRPPDEMLYCSDPRQLMIWASDPSDALHRAWACAVLRVAHTAAHMDGVWAKIDVEEALAQIRRRFEQFLHYEKDQGVWFGDERDRVLLDHIEWKAPKTRKSVFLKLLHKPANVAENIYDLLGVRLITKRLSDTMLAVKYLRDFHVVTFANCNPGRVRNSLIDFSAFKETIDAARLKMLDGDIDIEAFYETLDQIDQDMRQLKARRANPHSADAYQSIQLTCRQLIESKNAALEWSGRMTQYVKDLKKSKRTDEAERIESFLKFALQWPGMEEEKERSAFFPFEVQIMDAEAYEVVKYGDASHERYKMSQVRTARRRVLGEVFRLVRKINRDKKQTSS